MTTAQTSSLTISRALLRPAGLASRLLTRAAVLSEPALGIVVDRARRGLDALRRRSRPKRRAIWAQAYDDVAGALEALREAASETPSRP